MINKEDIENNFTDIEELPEGIMKFKDVVPAFSLIYYFRYNTINESDLLVVVKDVDDDIFAEALIRAASSVHYLHSSLSKHAFSHESNFSFTHMLLVPPQYHSYFRGRLDRERTNLFLVLPIFNCEFSGSESVELFYRIRREIVPSLDWKRGPSPLAMVRFNNQKTGGGTAGGSSVPIRYDVLKDEIYRLDGVISGFIEVTNYRGNYLEILSMKPGMYSVRFQDGSHGKNLDYEKVINEVWRFLSE